MAVEFMQVVRQRRSVRRYRSDPVPQVRLDHLLEAARLAPSWGNGQCWTFVVVTDGRLRHELGEAGNPWVSDAPVVIVACADPRLSGRNYDQQYYLVDVGIAMEHLVLAATDQGLGTCWVGRFDETRVKRTLGIPDRIRVVALTPVGYPDEWPAPRPRKTLGEIVRRDRWA